MRYRVDVLYPESWLAYSRRMRKNIAKYVLAQELCSDTHHIHSPVEVDGLRFVAAHIFYSPANYDMQPLIINI